MSLAAVAKPPGSRLAMAKGLSIPSNLNNIIRGLRDQEDWVWFMGDDHTFHPMILHHLLSRNLDVVVPICSRRRPPFQLVLYDGENEEGHTPIYFAELPETGTFPVYAAGTAGMLVRRHVLDAISDPWFEHAEGEQSTEDLEFCRKVRAAGFQIHADVEARLGHISFINVAPAWRDEWGVEFDLGVGENGAPNTIFLQLDAPDEARHLASAVET